MCEEFNNNVGDMPLEIFGDYISDFLCIEYTWKYLVPILNDYFFSFSNGDSSYPVTMGGTYYPTLGLGDNGDRGCGHRDENYGCGWQGVYFR